MKKLLIVLLSLLVMTIGTTCKKDATQKATVYVKTWLQSNYEEYGYYNNGQFHYTLSAFEMENIDSIDVSDTLFTSLTGVIISIQSGITYVLIGTEYFPVEQRIEYGTAEIHYVIDNVSYSTISEYEILFDILYSDGSTEEIVDNGTEIQKRTSEEITFYHETDGKRIIQVDVSDYAFYKN